MENLKIIDLWGKGNTLRFVLGDPDVDDYYGDDWDDTPWTSNCGDVYEEFIKGYSTIYFDYDAIVRQPDETDNYCCRDDFKNGLLPCLVVVPPQYADVYCLSSFNNLVRESKKPNSPIIAIYFNDKRADVLKRLYASKAIVYES